MDAPISNPAKYEVRGLLCYLCIVKNRNPRMFIVKLLLLTVASCRVNEWRSGVKVLKMAKQTFTTKNDRRLTMNELHEKYPKVIRTVLYETIADRLKFRKLCARWVPANTKQSEFVQQASSSAVTKKEEKV